jgi:glycosyltransferase involved in cell wall biosynthesis
MRKFMKILVVQESDWFDRGPLQSHHLMERLSKRGHEIIVIDTDIRTKDNIKDLVSKRVVYNRVHKVIDSGDVTVIRPSIIKIPVLNYVSLIFSHRSEIQKQIDEFNPDVIIGFGILNANIAINLAKKRGIPFIYYIIDELHRLVPQKLFQIPARIIESKNMKNANKIIAINESLRDYTIQMGAKKEKTEVIRGGVELDFFNKIDSKIIRAEYGIKDDDIILFFMGLLYRFSGLIEVAKDLEKMNDDKIKLLILGKGDLWDDLQDIRRKSGMERRIIMAGWKPYDEIPEYLAASDICLLPAHKNDIMMNIVPIKMYEYMAMGKPVIATELPGLIKEFGEDNGVLFVNQAHDVIAKVKEMHSHNLISSEGIKARRFVEPLGWESITTDFERLITEVIE